MNPILVAPPVVGPVVGPVAAPGAPEGDATALGGFGALVAGHLASLTASAMGAVRTSGADATAETETEAGVSVEAGPDGGLEEDSVTSVRSAGSEESEASEGAVPVENIAVPAALIVVPPVTDPAGERPSGAPRPDTGSTAGTSGDPVEGGSATSEAVRLAGAGTIAPTPVAAEGATAPATKPALTPVPTPVAAEGATAPATKPALTPVPTEGATAPATPTPLAAPAGISLSAPANPSTSSGNAVTSQVFPTVPALVSRGEGAHSITLRLHPADLGEVRVTVTVRNGNVDVTLAAGPAAQEALRTGSGELRSLLDLVGSATGQLIVRDLPGSAAPPPTGTGGSAFQLPTDQSAADGGAPGRRQGEDNSPGPHAPGERPGRDATELSPPDRPRIHAPARLDLTL